MNAEVTEHKRGFSKFARDMRTPSSIPRREAYLFTWGVGYTMLAVAWTIYDSWWGVFFFVAGIFSILAAIYGTRKLTALAFSALSGTAVIHALSFFVSLIAVALPMQMSIMWIIVAMAHVIIAGWPVHCLDHSEDKIDIYDSESLTRTISEIQNRMRDLESLNNEKG